MYSRLLAAFLAGAFLVSGIVAENAKGLIMMIPDGTGPAVMTLARECQEDPSKGLVLDTILKGAVRTYSTDSLVTDSSSSATAYSTGHKTTNGFVGMDDDQNYLKTIMEAAKEKGMVTGVIVTSRVTHATPASFLSHVNNRDNETEIARQFVYEQEPDFVLGGGARNFNEEQLEHLKSKGYTIVTDKDELAAYKSDVAGACADIDDIKLYGLFAKSHIRYEIDADEFESQPSLSFMAKKILDLIPHLPKARENGFLIMIEGSRVDHAAHDNDASSLFREALEFDKTVGIVKEFVDKHPSTSMISVADHETGGLSAGRLNDTAWEELFTCGDEECNGYSLLNPYVYYPKILQAQTKSSELVTKLISKKISVCRDESSTEAEQDACIEDLHQYTAELMREHSSVPFLVESEIAHLDDIFQAEVKAGKSYWYEIIKFVSTATSRRAYIGWNTGGHSGVDVGLYCHGDAKLERSCMGVMQNTAVNTIGAKYLGLEEYMKN